MQELVTVIIPVYNTERFLPKCIDSIIGQTYRNLEIILVDDGSTDSSLAVCNGYAAKDGRVLVIHKENGGSSSARNAGLAAANGDFITFVDSDDFLEADAYRMVMEVRKDTASDIVCYGMSFWNDRKEKRIPFADNGDLFLKFRKYRAYMHSPCNKIIRRKSLEGKFFRYDIRVLEDLLFMFDLMTDGCSILYLNDVLYHYRRDNAGSVTRQANKNASSTAYDRENVYYAILDICRKKKLLESESLQRYIRFLNARMSIHYVNDPILFSPDIFRKRTSLGISIRPVQTYSSRNCLPSCTWTVFPEPLSH
ncbi:MAG: glycosyltransferase family 2 protein [Treponema sp.]|nr:glycosyltransferase family 2 protein [Treponema sp.]